MNMPPIVSPQAWESASVELLVEEKALTRARDALAAKRRRMPRKAVDKDYAFEGPNGPASLLDLFEGRRQLSGGTSTTSTTSRPSSRRPLGRRRLAARLGESALVIAHGRVQGAA